MFAVEAPTKGATGKSNAEFVSHLIRIACRTLRP